MTIVVLPLAVQGLIMFVDEFYFHHRRNLGKWERWGHPLDTLTVIAPTAYLYFTFTDNLSLWTFVAMGLFSSLFVTKDEWVHAKECVGAEHWLHALLFIVHPLVFWSLWKIRVSEELNEPLNVIAVFLILQILFFIYQVFWWIWLGGSFRKQA